MIQKPYSARGKNAPSMRRPRQERSRQRFEAILDAAAELLESLEPEDISIYTLAEQVKMSPPSIYHFFPDANWVFVALAERIYERFLAGFDEPAPGNIASWQDLLRVRFEESRLYYNSNGAARRLLLGSGLSSAIRVRDLEIDRELSTRAVDGMEALFILPEIPDLVDRITEMMVLSDALWSLSVYRTGYITDEMAEQARRARESYARTFFPEYLPLRPVAGQ